MLWEKVCHLDNLWQCLPHSFNKTQDIKQENSNGKNLSIMTKKFHINFCQVKKIGLGLGPTTKVKGELPVLLMTSHCGLG